MGEAVRELKGITSELDLRFVRTLMEQNGELRIISPIKWKDTDAFLVKDDFLTYEHLDNLSNNSGNFNRLEKIISQCVQIPEMITIQRMEKAFYGVINRFRERGVCDFTDVEKPCKDIMNHLFEYEINNGVIPDGLQLPLNTLTLLSEKNVLFKASLFSAMLGSRLLREIRGKDTDIGNIFYIGLFQDIGKFFLEKIEPFNSDKIDKHPLISSEILSLGDFSKEVIQGVRTHETFLNGYGFFQDGEKPSYKAQVIQVANLFLKNYVEKNSLEYVLGKLDSLCEINSNGEVHRPILSTSIVQVLFDFYSNSIDQKRFSYYKEFSYYQVNYDMMLKKIKDEFKPLIYSFQKSKHYQSIDDEDKKLFGEYLNALESCGNYLNGRLTEINATQKNLDSLKIVGVQEFKEAIFQVQNYGVKLNSLLDVNLFEKPASFLKLKFEQMLDRQ